MSEKEPTPKALSYSRQMLQFGSTSHRFLITWPGNMFLACYSGAQAIDHDSGSHGIPGLYFKYDVSALKVIVKQDREHLIQFMIRLCSIIAGIVVISGLINRFILFSLDCFIKTVSPSTFQQLKEHAKVENVKSEKLVQNKILMSANVFPTVPVNLTVVQN